MATAEEFQPIISDQLWALAVGEILLKMAKSQGWLQQVDQKAIQLLSELQFILDDSGLDDAACLRRMDQVLEAWHGTGLHTTRHLDLD